jgi:hypothetical protein
MYVRAVLGEGSAGTSASNVNCPSMTEPSSNVNGRPTSSLNGGNRPTVASNRYVIGAAVADEWPGTITNVVSARTLNRVYNERSIIGEKLTAAVKL